MKKTLFYGLVSGLLISASGLSYADGPGKFRLLTPKRFVTKAEQARKLATLEYDAQGKHSNVKPVFPASNRSGGNSNSITAVTTFSDLGQSINPFTILGAGRNVISVVPSLNTVAFFRRGGIDDAGGLTNRPGNKVFYDLNTKGGADGQWQLSRGPIFDDDAYIDDPTHTAQGGPNNFGARYPQGALFNPAGNTDTANVVSIGNARVLDGTNDAWGGLGLGWQKLAAGSASKQSLEGSADPLHFRQESMEVTANAVFVTEPIEDLASGGVVFTDKIAVYKFTYNSASDEVEKTNVFIPFANEGGDYATSISNTSIAFGPDGQVGFLVVSAANNAFDSVATYIPYISKTMDGGTTWSDLTPIKINKKKGDTPNAGLDAFRDKMFSNLVYFDAEGNLNAATYADAASHNIRYVDYLVNDLDVVVDKDNYAHVIMSIAVSGFGDTLNATFPGGITYYPGYGSYNMHMYFNDVQGTVKGELINQNVGLNGCWGDCAGTDNFSDANRPQAARSEDGSVVMFAWYDTDSSSHPQLTDDNNSNPDLWTQRLKVVNAGEFFYGPQTRNMTKNSDNDGLAALGNVAPRLLNGANGNYQLASTIATFADFDPATGTAAMPTQHLYVGNVNVPISLDSFPNQVNGTVLNGSSSPVVLIPTISTKFITNISSTTAVTGGDITNDGNGSVTSRGVCWSTTPAPTVSLSTKTVNGSGTGSFNSIITNLTPGTVYYVRAYATNSAGTGYGSQRTFTTTAAISTPSVFTSASTAITETSATSGGIVVSDGGATVSARGVCWSIAPNPIIGSANQTIDGTGVGAFSSSLSSLLPGTIYYLRAYATNSAGTAYGNQVIFQTNASLQFPNVSTNPVTEIAIGSATSGGNATVPSGSSEIISKGICWSTSQNPTIDLATKTNEGPGAGSFTSNLTGLSAGTSYFVRAYATNSVGTAYGQQVSFQTLSPTSSPVVSTNLVTNISQTGAISGGSIINDGGSTILYQGLVWGTSPNPDTTSSTKTVIFGSSSSFIDEINNLNPSTTYYVRAYARNASGVGYGNQYLFTTLGSVTPASINIDSIRVNADASVSIYSNILYDGGAEVTKRGACWGLSPDPLLTDNMTTDGSGSGTFVSTTSSLVLNSSYYFRAYAINAVDTSYSSSSLTLVGTKNAIEKVAVLAYPNPFTNSFTIRTSSNKAMQFKLFDMYGKVLVDDLVVGEKDINLSNIPAGIYYLRFPQTGATTRLVKSKN